MRGSTFKSGKGWGYVHDVLAPDGQRKQKKKRGFPTKTKAQEALTASLHEAPNGAWADLEKITVAAYIERFIETRDGSLAETSVKRIKWALKSWIAPLLGAVKIADLTPDHLDRFYLTLRQSKLKPVTQSGIHKILKQILTRGAARREVRSDLFIGVHLPKSDRAEYTVLTPEQQAALLTGLEGRAIYPLVFLLLTTGMRPGEVVNLTWKELDLSAGVIRLPKEKTKTRTARTVSLYPETKAMLMAHRKKMLALNPEQTNVFRGVRNAAWTVMNLSLAYQRELKKIEGIPKMRLYDLRHTHASDLISAGVPITDVAARLGHSPEVLLRVYAHATKDGNDLALQLGGNRFRAALNGTGAHQRCTLTRVK